MQEITAEYLKKTADNISKVYEAGVIEGRKAQLMAFWGGYQSNGNSRNFNNAFMQAGWNDTTYDPQFPFVNIKYATSMFQSSMISDTKQDISFDPTAKDITRVFAYTPNLVNVHTLTVHETLTYTEWFLESTALAHIRIVGVIGKTFNIKYSPLTVESAKSILTHLKNYSGTDSEFAYSVLFHADVWVLLDAEGNTAPHGGSWREYVDSLCWNR